MTATDGLAKVNDLATNYAFTAWNGVSDFLIIIILFSVLFLFAWYVGRATLVSVLMAFYAGFAVYKMFPFMSYLPTAPAMTALLSQVGLYAALTLIFYIILRRVVVSDFLYVGIFGTIILAFLGAAFMLALAFHVFPVASIYTFTPAVSALFAPAEYFFWWFAAPAVGLFFLAR
ncbi:MAG: hypothetical protein AAB555_01165 [Patescibacteria group bacterium]